MAVPHSGAIPVTLLTGFLGSGKTTLLNALLRDPANAGIAVLINEVGEVGIDHLLVETISEEIVLLESGCLCCTVRGDLSRSLRDLFMRRLQRELPALDRVVIETTGLADPAPVIHTLMHDFFIAERFRLDGVITTVDVRHAHWQLGQHAEAVKQAAMADRIVLTKCDLAEEDDIRIVESRLTALNPTARRWRTRAGEAPSGLFEGMSFFDPATRGEDVMRWLGEVAAAEQERLMNRRPFGNKRAPLPLFLRHDERVHTHVLRFAQPFRWVEFSTALELLQQAVGERMLRLKGLVAVEGEHAPRVIHAVQHERYPASQLPDWPDEDRQTRLVFIVRDLPRESIEKAFAALCGVMPEPVLP